MLSPLDDTCYYSGKTALHYIPVIYSLWHRWLIYMQRKTVKHFVHVPACRE